MPKEHGGGSIITGDDKRDPVKFHQQLGNDRVHSLEDLTAVLNPFEEDTEYSRQNLPDDDLDTYLRHDENLHWGNPQYVYEGSSSNISISLEYTPWLNEDKDILLQGRVSIDQDAEKIGQRKEYKYFDIVVTNNIIEPLFDGNDLCWISVPTDPSTPEESYMEIDSIITYTLAVMEKE